MRVVLFGILMLFGASLSHGAEVYPNRPVHVITPYAPGGATDFVARLISAQLSEELGQTFIVDNRPGAGSTIGDAIAAKSTPDGYTLILLDPSFTMAPSLRKSLSYDVIKDFTPVTQIMTIPQALVVSPSVQAKTLKDLIALAQANPGKLNYGSAGVGTTTHIYMELFKILTKIDIAHVPYSGGSGAAMAGLLGDQIQMILTTPPTVAQYVQNGNIRALAVTTAGAKRVPSLPEVPSMDDGGVSGMDVNLWYGFAGPAGLPRDVVDTLRAAVQKAVEAPKVKAGILAQGGEALKDVSPEECSALIRNEMRRWAKVAEAAHIPRE